MNAQEVKKIYNDQASGIDYEKQRWFCDELSKLAYQMTREFIEKQFIVKLNNFTDFLEVGCGPGTWTKLFLAENPEAEFDLVDISSAMLTQARNNLSAGNKIDFFEADFFDFETEKKYDVFFSGRALEYFSNKKKFTEKIFYLLKKGGRGCLITKAPKYWREMIRGRKLGRLHRGQISPGQLACFLAEAGFSEIEFFPVTFYFPIFGSAALNRLAWRLMGDRRLNFINLFFCESYGVSFIK